MDFTLQPCTEALDAEVVGCRARRRVKAPSSITSFTFNSLGYVSMTNTRNILLIILSMVLCQSIYAQDNNIIDEIKSHTEGTKLWWAGHNGWIIKSDDVVITTDIFLEDDKRIEPSPITPEELAEVIDVSFITHRHGDHFNRYTSKVLLNNSDCMFVIPESSLPVAKELQIPDNRIVIAKPRESFEIEGIKVEALRAIHGEPKFAIAYEVNLQDVGYKMTIDGTTFLQPGDSRLLQDHLFLKHVDVLFFSPTEHNMYIDPSVILINTLNPDFIFPQHHSTIVPNEQNRYWTTGYQEEVRMRLSESLKKKYHILQPGESWTIK